jgi:hypothetical protein
MSLPALRECVCRVSRLCAGVLVGLMVVTLSTLLVLRYGL